MKVIEHSVRILQHTWDKKQTFLELWLRQQY